MPAARIDLMIGSTAIGSAMPTVIGAEGPRARKRTVRNENTG